MRCGQERKPVAVKIEIKTRNVDIKDTGERLNLKKNKGVLCSYFSSMCLSWYQIILELVSLNRLAQLGSLDQLWFV